MKILFIKERTTWIGTPNLSLALGILGTILKTLGHTVKLLDNNSGFNVLSQKEILNTVKNFKPDIVMFSVSPLNAMKTYELVKAIKTLYPHIPLIGGGVHMKYCFSEAVKFGFDMVIRGEAETVIEEIVNIASSFNNKIEYLDKLSKVSYLAYPYLLKEKLQNVGFPPAPQDLDTIPFIDYNLFILEHYKIIRNYDKNIFNTLHTQRGCHYECTFCSDEILRKSVRLSSAQYMFDNLRHCYEYSHGPSFAFCDNVFTLSKQRVVEFSKLMQDSGMNKKIYFSCQTSILANIDAETVDALKMAGCTTVALGIERFLQESRFKLKKMISEDKLDRVIDLFNRAGISIDYFILVGLPFDTEELLAEEKQKFFKYEAELGYPVMSTLQPLPGTIYYDSYPKTKEWYLNKRYIDDIYSLYSGIYDMRSYFSYRKSNFYNMSRKDLKAIGRFILEMRRLRAAKKTRGSLVLKILVFIDFQVGKLSYIVYLLNSSWERKIFEFYPRFRVFIMKLFKYGENAKVF